MVKIIDTSAYVNDIIHFGEFINWASKHRVDFSSEWKIVNTNHLIKHMIKSFENPNMFDIGISSINELPFASKDDSLHPFLINRSFDDINNAIGLVRGSDYIVHGDGSHSYTFDGIRILFRELSKMTSPEHQNLLDDVINKFHRNKELHSIGRAEYLKTIETQTKAIQSVQGMLVIRMTGRAKFVISTDIQSKLLSLDELTDSMEEITLECFDDEVMPSEADVIMIENISKNNIAAAIIMYK